MTTEIRCQCRDPWNPTRGGVLAGWVEDGQVWRIRERIVDEGQRSTIDARHTALRGVLTVWCPKCGRGYAVAAERPAEGDWRRLGGLWVVRSARRRESHSET